MNRLTRICALTAAVALACSAGFAQGSGSAIPGPRPQVSKKPRKPWAHAGAVAAVDGVKITEAEYRSMLNRIVRPWHPPAVRKQAGEHVIKELIGLKLIDAYVTANRDKAFDKQVDEAMANIEKQARSAGHIREGQTLAQALSAVGSTVDGFRARVGRDLTVKKVLENKVTDETVRAEYDKDPGALDEVRASHILLLTQGKSDEKKAEALKKIKEMLVKVKAGEDFAALARQYSDCSSKAKGGDLDFFPREKNVPPFSKAAFAMKIGEISDIVETKYGYHIIKVTDRRSNKFEAAKDQLRRRLVQTAIDALIDGLRDKAKVEIDPNLP